MKTHHGEVAQTSIFYEDTELIKPQQPLSIFQPVDPPSPGKIWIKFLYLYLWPSHCSEAQNFDLEIWSYIDEINEKYIPFSFIIYGKVCKKG